jgi:hypothetical protein
MSKHMDRLAAILARQQSRGGFLRQATTVVLGGAALLGGAFAGLAAPSVASAAGCCGPSTCSGGGCPSDTNMTSMSTCCDATCGSKYVDCYYCYQCTQVNPPSGCTLLCQYSVTTGITCPYGPTR